MDAENVYNDAVLQQFERKHRGAVPIIFCAKHESHCKGWTGFVISKVPLIIITVSHGVSNLNNNLLKSELTFFVKFYGEYNYNPAKAIRWDHEADLLVLTCRRPCLDFFTLPFIDPDLPFLSSKSLFAISHAGDRHWRAIRGSICSPTFFRGDPKFYLDSILFDHDLQLYPGGSGAPLIDLMGQVCGIQNSEITIKEHAFVVSTDYRKKMDEYTGYDVGNIYRQISEFTFRPTNLKQATPVQEFSKRLKVLFLEEGVDPRTGLTEFLRQSVNIFLLREAHQSATASPAQAPQPSTSSQKRPPRRKKEVFSEREGIQFMPESVLGLCGPSKIHVSVLADDMGLRKTLQSMTLQCTLLPKEFGKNAMVSSSNGFAIPRSVLQVLIASYETSGMHLSIFSGGGSCDLLICSDAHMLKNCQTLTNGPEDCEDGDSDLATVAVDPLIAKFLGPRKRNFKSNPSTLAAPTCKHQIPLSGTLLSDEFACFLSSKAGSCGLNMIGGNQLVWFDPVWNPDKGKQAAARVWRDGLKDRVHFCRFLSTGTTEEKVYQRKMSEERLEKVIQEQTDLRNQGNFMLTEVLKGLFPLHENVSREMYEKMKCFRSRSWVGMVKDMPECYGEQDEACLANVNCKSDQEDIGAFAGITGCSSQVRKEMVESSNEIDGAADLFETDVDNNGSDVKSLANVNCQSNHEDLRASAGSTGCLHMLNSLEKQIRKEMVALSNDIDGASDRCFGMDAADNNGSREAQAHMLKNCQTLTNRLEDSEGGDNDLATVAVDPLIAKFLGPGKRNFKRDLSTLAAVTCQIPLSGTPPSDEFVCSLSSKAGSCGLNMIGENQLVLFDPVWNPTKGKQAAARVWRDGLKDRVYFCRFLSTETVEEKVYQHQMSEERLQKVIQEQTDLKNQGNFLLTEVLKDLSPLHENVSYEMYEKMNCVRSRSWVGMVNDMPECYGEQDEASLANVNCKSDQEDIGAFAGITGCVHMLNSSQVRKEMVALSNEIDGAADCFGTNGDNNGSDVKSLANVNCQSDHEHIRASAGSTGCLHMLNSLEKQIRKIFMYS